MAHTGFRSLHEDDVIQKKFRTLLLEPYEDDHPWVRETYNGMRRRRVIIRLLERTILRLINGSRITIGGQISFSCSGVFRERCTGLTYEIAWTSRENVRLLSHELAHLHPLAARFVDEQTEFIAAGWIYF